MYGFEQNLYKRYSETPLVPQYNGLCIITIPFGTKKIQIANLSCKKLKIITFSDKKLQTVTFTLQKNYDL